MRSRENDSEDDAGAAKLDTSPAVLSPSFILRTFYQVTSLDTSASLFQFVRFPSRLVPSSRLLLADSRAGRVDGVSRATSRTLFKITPLSERDAFCGRREGPPGRY